VALLVTCSASGTGTSPTNSLTACRTAIIPPGKRGAPLGGEAAQVRQALTERVPDEDGDSGLLVRVDKMLDDFLGNLTDLSRDLSSAELTDLDRVVERTLYDIDRADIQAVTDGSDDGFLYARGFIVALGEKYYSAVVRDPRMAVLDAWCEGICYFFAHVHSERFGDFPDTGSGISRESCTNREGWSF